MCGIDGRKGIRDSWERRREIPTVFPTTATAGGSNDVHDRTHLDRSWSAKKWVTCHPSNVDSREKSDPQSVVGPMLG